MPSKFIVVKHENKYTVQINHNEQQYIYAYGYSLKRDATKTIKELQVNKLFRRDSKTFLFFNCEKLHNHSIINFHKNTTRKQHWNIQVI